MPRRDGGQRNGRRATRPEEDPRGLLDIALPVTLGNRLERGAWREALVYAAELRRRGQVAAHVAAVERAYLGRSLELASKGLLREAEVLVRDAFDAGAGSPRLADLAFHCALGRGAREDARGWALDPRVEETARAELLADVSVLAPEVAGETGGAEPREPERSSIVRAFELLEAGADDQARDVLSAIPRRSPYARWRLVVLGLSARARGELDRARSCWERVSGVGAAASLAAALLRTAPPPGAPSESKSPESRSAESRSAESGSSPCGSLPPFPFPGDAEDRRVRLLRGVLEAAAGPRPVADRLVDAVRRFLASWPGGPGPESKERLLRALLAREDLDRETLRRVGAMLGGLPEDPELLRWAALRGERESPELGHALWHSYLQRLDGVSGLETDDRGVVLSLVWERMGNLARAGMSRGRNACDCPSCRSRRSRLRDTLKPGAAACFAESARLDPDCLAVRRRLVETLLSAGKKAAAERALAELLARWPTDVDTIVRLGEMALDRNAFLKAARLFETARSLEPLNRSVLSRLADTIVANAWHRATSGRTELARRDIRKAFDLVGAREFGRRHAVSAAIEFLAGDDEAGREILDRAIASGEWAPRVLLDAATRLEAASPRSNGARRGRSSRPSGGVPSGGGAETPVARALEEVESRLERAIRDLPCEASGIQRAVALYHELGDLGPKASWTVRRCLPHLRKYIERGAGGDLPESVRLEVCDRLRSTQNADLVRIYAAAGRKMFPGSYRFAILEAQARLVAGAAKLPRDLDRELVQARRLAEERRDAESLGALEMIDSLRALDGAPGGLRQAVEALRGLDEIEDEDDLLAVLLDGFAEAGLGDELEDELEGELELEDAAEEDLDRGGPRRRNRRRRG